MTSPGGLRTEETYSFWNASESFREEHRKVSNAAGQLVRHLLQKWQMFSWGEAIVAEVNDPDGAALTTTNTYYTNPAEAGRYSRLKTVVEPDGSWMRYDYDGAGRKIEEVRPFGDSPLTAPNAQARVTTYSYTPLDTNDTPTLGDQRPRTVVEAALGQEVSRTYHAYAFVAGEQVEITEQCAQPGVAYGAGSNQRTVSRHYAATNAVASAGLLRQVERPDGTAVSYDYAFGTYAPTAPSFTPGAGDAYRVTVTDGTVDHPEGIASKTTRKTAVFDNRGFNVLSENWVFAGGTNYARVAWTVRAFDAFGHATNVLYSSGLHEEATWDDCCGKASDIAADGVLRDYEYDDLGRLINMIKTNGTATSLSELYDYDAAGARVAVTRQGGGLSLTSNQRYDLAGRVTNSVDETGLPTFYNDADGGRTRTVTLPGGATRITTHYLDGRTKSVSGTAGPAQYFTYGVYTAGSEWTQVNTASPNSPTWSRTVTDLLGRTLREERPGYSGTGVSPVILINASTYNSLGQLASVANLASGSSVTSCLNRTIYAYNELGQQYRSGLDINTNGVLDLTGPDRITESSTSYQSDSSNNWWQVSASILYPADGSFTPTTNSIQRTFLFASSPSYSSYSSYTVSQDILGNTTISRTFVDRATKTVTQTTTYPDSTNNAVQVSINGLMQYSISKTGVRTDLDSDALGRPVASVNPRTGTSTTHYNEKGQVDWTHDPITNMTWYAYGPQTGRQIAVTNSLGNAIYTQFDPQGRAIATWGATYPVAYEFDEYGRMVAMQTWRDTNSAPDATQWLYDESTGLLTNKVYADGKGPFYTYTPEGKLATRTWARLSPSTGDRLVTHYSYDLSGALTNIAYSDTTPAVSFTLDRLGRQTTITDATGTRNFTYNDSLQLAAETNVMGVIQRQYDSMGRSTGFTAGTDCQVSYGYSGNGRFTSLTSDIRSLTSGTSYSYLPGSDLLSGWSNNIGSASPLTVSRSYEVHRDLITQVNNMAGPTVISQFDYQNDSLFGL